VRRLPGRIDGDASDGRRAAGWLAGADGRLHAVAVDGKTLRGAARATGSSWRAWRAWLLRWPLTTGNYCPQPSLGRVTPH
jgi:hypothetical protein